MTKNIFTAVSGQGLYWIQHQWEVGWHHGIREAFLDIVFNKMEKIYPGIYFKT